MGYKSRTHFASLEKNYVVNRVCVDCAKEWGELVDQSEKPSRMAPCPICKKNKWLFPMATDVKLAPPVITNTRWVDNIREQYRKEHRCHSCGEEHL